MDNDPEKDGNLVSQFEFISEIYELQILRGLILMEKKNYSNIVFRNFLVFLAENCEFSSETPFKNSRLFDTDSMFPSRGIKFCVIFIPSPLRPKFFAQFI